MTGSADLAAREVAGMARGGGQNLVGFAVKQAGQFALIALLARVLGTGGVGLYAEAFAVYSVASLIALAGSQATLTRFVAMRLVDGDTGAVAATIRSSTAAAGAISIALSIALFIAANPIAGLFTEPDLADPLRIAALALVPTVLSDCALAALRGWRSMKETVQIALLFEPIAMFVGAAAALSLGGGISQVLAVLVAVQVVSAGLAIAALGRRIDLRTPGTADTRELGAFAVKSWGASAATNALVWIDTLILAAIVSASEVGTYQVATRVVTLATFMMMPITQAFTPRIANLMQRERLDLLQAAYSAAASWILRLALPIFVILVVFPREILQLMGPGFAPAAAVTVVLAIGKFIDAASGPCGNVLNMSGRAGLNLINNSVALAVNVGLNLALIPRHGILGAAVAWATTLALLNATRLVQVHRLWGLWPFDRRAVNTLGAAAAAGGGALLVAAARDGFSSLAIGAIVAGGVYVVVSGAIGVSPEDREVCRDLVDALSSKLSTRSHLAARIQRSLARPVKPLVHRARPVAGPVSIDALVSPLRLDILVRAEFFEFARDHGDLYDDDPATFVLLARDLAYFTWFAEIAYPQLYPGGRPRDLNDAFAHRVHESVTLWRSISERGYDPATPIVLLAPRHAVPTSEGKPVARSHYAFDGCHRIAALLTLGFETLPPAWVRERRPRTLQPRDRTIALLRRLRVATPDYVGFLARAYAPGAAPESIAELRETATTNQEELMAVLEADAPARAVAFERASPRVWPRLSASALAADEEVR